MRPKIDPDLAARLLAADQPNTLPDPEVRPDSAWVAVLSLALGLLIGLGCCAMFGDRSTTSGGGGTGVATAVEAWVVAQALVENRLKAPSTADFPRFTREHVREVSPNRWRIESYVDAQNAFGASLRTRYVVDIESDRSGKWHVHEVRIIE